MSLVDKSALTPERWQAVKAAFAAAAACAPAERAACLDRVCGADAQLRQEVEALLAADADAVGFLSRAAVVPVLSGEGVDMGARRVDGAARDARFVQALEQTLGADYAVERELGGGGMSRVFVAHDARLGRRVVVKVLHPDLAAGLSARRFAREVAVAARLQHPHIVPLLNAGTVDGLPYYTMPFVAGESLRARLAREGRLRIADAVRLGRELADALAYAHGAGVVHRDLKPENVLLSGGHAVVADFGIARALATATQESAGVVSDTSHAGWVGTATAVGGVIGTPGYMAPEQALGDPTADHRVDLYALGVICYELLAGQPPFLGDTPQRLMAAHIAALPRPLAEQRPEVPLGLAALVSQLLAKGPADRPASAGAVLHEFDRLLARLTPVDGGSGTATPAEEPGAALRRLPTRWQSVAIAAAAVVLLSVGAVLARDRLLQPRDTADDASVPGPTRIAVLPFDNLGPAADAYFAEGLTEAIRGQLATLSALAVIDGRSTAEYRTSSKPLREIGRELDVAYVLRGTVQWAQGADGTRRVQVRPALVRVSDATTRWGAPYTAAPTDLFQVQADIAQRVADALDVTLDTRQRVVLAAAPTTNPAAYDHFLRGLVLEQRMVALAPSFNGWGDAIAAYSRAVRLDPSFGTAWARLASARLNRWVGEGQTDPILLTQARAAVDSARRLAPEAAETHVAVARLAYAVDRDYDRAVVSLRAAYRARPSDAALLSDLGSTLVFMRGGIDEGLRLLARAADLDPRQPPHTAAWNSILVGHHQQAIRYAERIIALSPEDPGGYSAKAVALIEGGAGVAAARRVMDTAVAHAGRAAVMRFLVLNWWNDAAGLLGEPYERQLEALSVADFAAPVSRMDSMGFYIVKAQHAWHTGRRPMARAYCDSVARVLAPWDRDVAHAVERTGGNAVAPLGFLAAAHACRGHVDDARRVADALRAVIERPHSLFDEINVPAFLANAAVFAGQRDTAVAYLERALRTRPSVIWVNWLRVDPFYASLRGDPRFEALLARARQ